MSGGTWLAVLAGMASLASAGPILALATVVGAVGVGLGRLAPSEVRRRLARALGVGAGLPALAWAAWGGAPREVVGLLVLALLVGRVVAGAERAAVLLAAMALCVLDADRGLLAVPWWAVGAAWGLADPPWALGAPAEGRTAAIGRMRAVLTCLGLAAATWAIWPRRPPAPRPAPVLGITEVLDAARPPLASPPDTVRLRVTVDPPVEGPVYLRGTALSAFDGARWSSPEGVWAEADPGGEGARFEVVAEAPSAVLLTAGNPHGVGVDGPWFRDAAHTRVVAAPVRSWRFSAAGPYDVGAVVDRDAPTLADFALPPDLDPDFRRWVAEVTAGQPDPLEALVGALGHGFVWTIQAAEDGPADLADFVRRARAGHCVWFASALGAGARVAGLPARVVTGYRLDPSPDGRWTVTAGDAHAWVEVHRRGVGWVLVDPTPTVAAPDPGTLPLGSRLAVVAGVGLLWIGAVWGARRRRPVRPSTVVRGQLVAWQRVRGALDAAGWAVPAALPPVSAARWVARDAADAEAGLALVALAEAYSAARWGPGASVDDATLVQWERTAMRLVAPAGARR